MKLDEGVVLLVRVAKRVARCGVADTPWQYVIQRYRERHVVTALHPAGRGPEAPLSSVVGIGPLEAAAASLSWAKASMRPLLRRRQQVRG